MVFPIPLGLGLKPPKFPILSVFFALSWAVCYLVFPKVDLVKLEKRLNKKYNVEKLYLKTLADFCSGEAGKTKFKNECAYLIDQYKTKSRKLSLRKWAKKNLEKKDNSFSSVISLSRNIEKLKNNAQDYFSPGKDLSNYLNAKKSVSKDIKRFQKKLNLLTNENINFSSILKAQFTHAGIGHLFGNVISFIFFSIYVESRLGVMAYLLLYFVSGSAGLFFNAFLLKEHVYLLGASANVLGVVGGSFVLFFKHYFKLYFALGLTPIPKFLCYSKTYLIKMKYAIPIFFVLGDLTGAINPQGSVAHVAHLGGFFGGCIISFVHMKIFNIPWPFIYPSEIQDFKNLKVVKNRRTRLSGYSKLLAINPMNKEIQEVLMYEVTGDIIENNSLGELDYRYLVAHTEPFVGRACYHRKFNDAYSIMKRIPLNIRYDELIPTLGKRATLKLADYSLDQGSYYLSLKLYDHYLSLIKRKKNKILVLKTVENLISEIIKRDSNSKRLKVVTSNAKTSEVYKIYSKKLTSTNNFYKMAS